MKTETNIIYAAIAVFALACFALSPAPSAFGVVPAPDGGYPGFNTAEGQNALLQLTTGTANTAVGWLSLENITTGSFNTGVGAGTLFANTADSNTATGAGALLSNTTGGGNTANGAFALLSNSTGAANTAYGYQALFSNATAIDNVAIGYRALFSSIAEGNTAVGSLALRSNIEGGFNTATGDQALYSTTTGGGNTATGERALRSNTAGEVNTATGSLALFSNTTGNFNTAIGDSALFSNTTGDFNTVLGAGAGKNVTTANDVIAIGSMGANVSNSCFIGHIRGVTTANANAIPVLIDSAGQLGTVSSSRRYKKEIKPMDQTSESILGLKPVTFHYKSDKIGTPQFGLIAEEVAEVNPDLVVRDEKGEIYTVRYDAVNAMLLNEFLKQNQTVQELKKQVAELTAGLQKVSAQLAAASPSHGGLEASKFATGRIRGGGPAQVVVNTP